jgi:hypothetical protein
MYNKLLKTTLRLALVSAIFAASVLPQTVMAKTIYVKENATGNGTSWDNAYGNLQTAINEASATTNDEIWVYEGTYKPQYTASGWRVSINNGRGDNAANYPTRDGNQNNAFVLKSGVKIYGGFTSTSAVESLPNFGSAGRDGISTLSGDIDATGNNDAYHVVICVNVASSTVLDGFTISGGNANGNSSDITVNRENSIDRRYGGGIYNYNSSPTLSNLIISGNSATYGGGIYNASSSSPTLTGVIISGNSATNGGGIYNTASSPKLTNVTISGNKATTNGGGGIYNTGNSDPSQANTIVWGNSGGSVQDNGRFANPTYTNSLVQGEYPGGEDGNNYDGITSEDASDPDPKFVSPVSADDAPTTGGDYRLWDLSPYNNKDLGAYKTHVAQYGISLSLKGTMESPSDFDSKMFGYGEAPAAVSVVATNTGNAYTGDLNIKLTGDANAFDITDDAEENPKIIGSIAGFRGEGRTFKIVPKIGLNANIYIATVTVSNNDITESFVVRFNVYRATLTATDFTINMGAVDYTGSPQKVTVTPKDGLTGIGNIKIFYDASKTSTKQPTDAGEYDIVVDIEIGQNFNELIGLKPEGKFKINKIDPKSTDLTCDLTAVDYTGKEQGVNVTGRSTGVGEITKIKYNGLTDMPTDAGTYEITVDIDGSGKNFNAKTNLLIGNFVIKPIKPTVDVLDITLPEESVYNGQPQPAGVKAKGNIAGLGTITVLYNGNTDVPTNVGEYEVTVDIATGGNYTNNRSSVMSLGKFKITRAKITIGDINLIAYDLRNVVGNGSPQSVTVTAAEGIVGLGTPTVWYCDKSGDSKTPPIDPGSYTIKVTIEEAGGNYEAFKAGWTLGTFTIFNPSIPHHRVTLPSAPGLITYPSSGVHYINGGANFSFRIKLDAPSVTGTPPQVQTNRTATRTDGNADIIITPESDGLSYTVVILAINEDIEISLDTPTGNASVVAGTLTLGTAPGALVITNTRADAATLRVYTPAGAPVRLTTVPPGTTHLTVPPGIYIVTDGGAFRRKIAVVQ